MNLSGSVCRRRPGTRVHFVINRNVPIRVRQGIPDDFGVTLLSTSPTLDDDGVFAALERCDPDIVLFDNAGSGRQCRFARQLGARTVFLSSRRETMQRALGLDWLPWLDEHWFVGPRLSDTDLSPWERGRLNSAPATKNRCLDAVFLPFDHKRAALEWSSLGLDGKPYVCFLPGGGGGTIDGRSAVGIFADAAAIVTRKVGIRSLLLQGPLYQGPDLRRDGVTVLRASHTQTVDLVQGAHMVVVGASSSLFQALAQKKVCVATSSGGNEQQPRAVKWGKLGVVAPCEPEPAKLAETACALLQSSSSWETVHQKVVSLAASNGIDQALTAIEGLITTTGPVLQNRVGASDRRH